MKKLFYAAAFAALALTGCSTEEESVAPVPPPADKVPVGFSTSIVEVTRGVPVAGTAFGAEDKIGVYGIEKKGDAQTANWMENILVTNKPAGTWTYTGDFYLMKGYTYQFAAYAPYDAAWTTDLSDATALAAVPYTVSTAIADQKDFMYALSSKMDFTSAAPTDASKVSFAFNHALSQVKFKVKTAKDYSGYTLKISKIELANIATTGTLNFNGGIWTPSTTAFDKYFQSWTDKTIATDMSETDLNPSGDILMLIPQAVKDKEMTVTVNVDGTDQAITMKIPNEKWEASHAYTYTITLYLDQYLGLKAAIDTVTIGVWQNDSVNVDNKPTV